MNGSTDIKNRRAKGIKPGGVPLSPANEYSTLSDALQLLPTEQFVKRFSASKDFWIGRLNLSAMQSDASLSDENSK
jgi:hypothetical protein